MAVYIDTVGLGYWGPRRDWDIPGERIGVGQRLRYLQYLRASGRPGDVVVTGPRGRQVWQLLPPTVIVRVVPDQYEVKSRYSSVEEWAGAVCGFSLADSRRYAAKPPTPRARAWLRWQRTCRLVKCVGQDAPTSQQQASVAVLPSLRATIIGVDTETTGLEPWNDRLLGVSVSDGQASVYMGVEDARRWLEECDAEVWVFQNAKFDLQFLEAAGFHIPRQRVHDVQLVAHLLGYEELGLKHMARVVLGWEMVDFKQLLQYYGSTEAIPADVLQDYAARDAAATLELWNRLYPQLSPAEQFLYLTVEQPLIGVLADMESRGVLLADAKTFALLIEEYELERSRLLAQLQVGGWPADPTAKKQGVDSYPVLSAYLYKARKLPVLAKTPSGKPATDRKTLERLAVTVPGISVLLEYRKVRDLLNKFLYPLRGQAGQVIHPSIHQAKVYDPDEDDTEGTASGRLAYSKPNLQQFAKKGGIRSLIVARPGMSIVAGDWGQLELCVYADRANDEVLIEAFAQGEDVHDRIRVLTGLPPEERSRVKGGVFGRLYGAEAPKLSVTLGLPLAETMELVNSLDKAMPRMRQWAGEVVREARMRGYSETVLGRRRRIANLYSADASIRSKAERALVNMTIQGTAAEMAKMAMDEWDRQHPEAPLLMQVHDELVVECLEGQESWYAGELARVMKGVNLLRRVALSVDVGWGKSWQEAKDNAARA